jgi:hypothetical protein
MTSCGSLAISARPLCGDAVRLYVFAETRGRVSYSDALRELGMPYGDCGRAMVELIGAGMFERSADCCLVVGGAQ